MEDLIWIEIRVFFFVSTDILKRPVNTNSNRVSNIDRLVVIADLDLLFLMGFCCTQRSFINLYHFLFDRPFTDMAIIASIDR